MLIPALLAGVQLDLVSVAFGGIWPLVNGALLVSTLFYRLRGIQL
jgi:hypothetical protein